jgi:Putative rhamnosyl transferase
MPMEFKHLVLTRFNTALSFAPPAQRLQKDWLDLRLVPFEQYCLPSMAAQRGASFEWLVFLDEESPEWLKERMRSFAPLVTPLLIKGPLTDEVIASSVAATGLVSAPYLITTRIDSDDAFASDHLAMVQKAFQRQERQFLDYPFGLESYRGHLYNCYWPSNSFISLIERVQSGNRFTTVHCVKHDQVYKTGLVKKFRRSAQWIHVIHSRNTLSGLRSLPKIKSASHPGFEVRWLPPDTGDSFATRVKISAEEYLTRVGKLLRKKAAGPGKWVSES